MKKTATILSLVFLTIFILLLLSGFFYFFESPKITGISSFHVTKFSNEEIIVDCNLKIMNSNPYSIFCKKLDVTTFVEGGSWIQSTLICPTQLASETETDIPVRCLIKNNLSHHSLEEVLVSDNISITNKISGAFTFLGIPYQKRYDVVIHPRKFLAEHIKMLVSNFDFSIDKMELKKIDLQETVVSTVVKFKNIMYQPIILKEGTLNIFSSRQSDDTLSSWIMENDKEVTSKQEVEIPIEWTIRNLTVGKWGLMQISNGYFEAFIKGSIMVSIFNYESKLPVEQQIRIYPLSQKIEMINK